MTVVHFRASVYVLFLYCSAQQRSMCSDIAAQPCNLLDIFSCMHVKLFVTVP